MLMAAQVLVDSVKEKKHFIFTILIQHYLKILMYVLYS